MCVRARACVCVCCCCCCCCCFRFFLCGANTKLLTYRVGDWAGGGGRRGVMECSRVTQKSPGSHHMTMDDTVTRKAATGWDIYYAKTERERVWILTSRRPHRVTSGRRERGGGEREGVIERKFLNFKAVNHTRSPEGEVVGKERERDLGFKLPSIVYDHLRANRGVCGGGGGGGDVFLDFGFERGGRGMFFYFLFERPVSRTRSLQDEERGGGWGGRGRRRERERELLDSNIP